MAQQRGPQNRELLMGHQTAEAFLGFQHCGRNAIRASRQCLTLRQTCRSTAIRTVRSLAQHLFDAGASMLLPCKYMAEIAVEKIYNPAKIPALLACSTSIITHSLPRRPAFYKDVTQSD